MIPLAPLQQWLQDILVFFADDPVFLALQISILFLASVHVILLCFATRDVLLRIRSLLAMILCIVVIACLPFVGFVLYCLLRPSQTLQERMLTHMVQEMQTAIKRNSGPIVSVKQLKQHAA